MAIYSNDEIPWYVNEDPLGIEVVTQQGVRIYRTSLVPGNQGARDQARRNALFVCLMASVQIPSLRWEETGATGRMAVLRTAGLPIELATIRWNWLTSYERDLIAVQFEAQISSRLDEVVNGDQNPRRTARTLN